MYRRSQRWMQIINNRFLSVYDYNILLVIEKIFSVNKSRNKRFNGHHKILFSRHAIPKYVQDYSSIIWHFSWLFSLCSSSFSRRIVGFLFPFLLFWIIVLMLVVPWRLLLMPRGPLEAALGTIIFHQQRNRDIVSVSSFYVTGNKERTIHCQRLVWITLVFSLVLPQLLGLDAWVLSLHHQV